MESLMPLAGEVAELLKKRGETVALSESSMGGLVSAALVAQAGASAFYLGSTVIYTRGAARALYDLKGPPAPDVKPLTEPYVAAMAEVVREKFGASWAISEMGASGPSGSPYGPGPGTAVIGLAGPRPASITVSTGSADRVANMRAFGEAALRLILETLTE
ncbi:CinA family protein [Parvibaculum sp.]|jgi:nicotinamide-nucleotide amidase|uniref:CinA family protein n=1 Tax=Parvibaculum sp. TaxID=2024848 RepID=UPI000C4A9F94|nr:CinA family protein [Parvibaculum sp.]MAM96037.1 damage-inducible protein [Parvibaculum sp.]HCX66544.1 damage-inducible protein [Rhodobiaceae bacterium]|tara:strand:+ start:388 stop:870 length:483 start_codon:yes stop_codon:yes gene_type:complete